MSLKYRITLQHADRNWLNAMATEYHYLHRQVPDKACPFGWAVGFDGNLFQPDGLPSGFIIFASIHFTKLRNEFGYPGLPTKWQVLSLSRLWLHENLPKNSETCVIGKALELIQQRWLEVHPPRYPEQPYHIVKILSYADTEYHEGTIYRAANFREYGRTVSHKRHKNSRGPGCDGHELICFIYDLRKPRWNYVPQQLPLFGTTPAIINKRTI